LLPLRTSDDNLRSKAIAAIDLNSICYPDRDRVAKEHSQLKCFVEDFRQNVWLPVSITFGVAVNSCFSGLNPQTPVSECDRSSPSPIAIRAVDSSDLHPLAEVLVESFHPANGWMCWVHPALKFGIYEDIRSRLNRDSPHYLCLAAIAQTTSSKTSRYQPETRPEQLVGTVEIALRPLGISKKHQYPYISNLAVCKSYRRQGIARKLLLGCEPAALEWGFRDIYLHVLENNERAKHLYVSCGYQLSAIESSLGTWLFNRPRRLLLHKSLS